MKNNVKKLVFVGLSGGVDSAVSAYLLKQQGFQVTGVFIKTWSPDWMKCSWRDERRDAMRVAIHLGIPFIDLDLTEEYKKGVADYMISEYRAGRTPNPDVMCNREVKFGGFLKFALEQGADYVATGHYAQVEHSSNGSIMKRGIDNGKDQSYFLWTLRQDQLRHILFPVGGLEKSKTREIAELAKLPVSNKKDSQGICFLGQVDMREFLLHYIPENRGNVVDENGIKIGEHIGVNFYTVGEKTGPEITDTEFRKTMSYIIQKDIENNILVVSHSLVRAEEKNNESTITLHSVNDFFNSFETKQIVEVQIRYHGEIYQCEIVHYSSEQATMEIRSEKPFLVASGQSIVFYDNEVFLGGAIVK